MPTKDGPSFDRQRIRIFPISQNIEPRLIRRKKITVNKLTVLVHNFLKRVENYSAPLLRLLGRVVVKVISYDGERLRMHAHGLRIQGPPDRLFTGRDVDLQNAYLNTVCGSIRFGDYAFCGANCMFVTGTHDYNQRNAVRRYEHPDSGHNIVIGNGVWICSGAIVLGGVQIADHAVIAAGAVVTSDCPQAGVYAGIPARLVKKITFSK